MLLSEQLARATGLTREEEERERRAVQLGVLRHVAEAGSPERALEAIAAAHAGGAIGDADKAALKNQLVEEGHAAAARRLAELTAPPPPPQKECAVCMCDGDLTALFSPVAVPRNT